MTNALRCLFLAALAVIFSSNVFAQNDDSARDAEAVKLLKSGTSLITSGQSVEAVAVFDKVIATYEAAFKDDKRKLYSAHTRQEALMYMVEAANAKTDAEVVSPNWADAYYLKGYALVELRKTAEAKAALQRALELAPHDAQYWGELGAVYQLERDWPAAISAFQSAAAASEFSAAQKNADLSRAWRGLGYVYVELKQFDEAEKWYQKCLALDGNDDKAKNELRYIQTQREK